MGVDDTSRQTYALGLIETVLEAKYEQQWQESLVSLERYFYIHGP